MANVDSVDASAFTDDVVLGSQFGLKALLNGSGTIAAASQISTTGSAGQFFTHTVQGNLDEISALVPPRPSTVGNFSKFESFTGIPDWGILKLNDAGLVTRGLVIPPSPSSPNSDDSIYPYYWVAPEVADDDNGTNPLPFVVPGNDPRTDPTFNVADLIYTGGGDGETHAGGFTRTGLVIESVRVMPPAGGVFVNVVVSGALFPADRGVLALIHWPAGGDTALFLSLPLVERCPAAILLGQGINGQTPTMCDGDPGGIFSEGDPNVFAFPGRATGQYDLVELHAGINNQTGDPLPDGPQPSAGKVRLGTDPAAGAPVVPGGIPILGATTLAIGGGNDNNIFSYRLPYLDDYSAATGIKFTPDVEKPRYFQKPAIALNPGIDLVQAGDYDDFGVNYWTYQVSRYRHRFEFFFNSCPCPGGNGTIDQGSFFLVHFKRERDFEAYIRDGVFPDDPMDGYEIYSADLVDYANPESPDNLTAGGLATDPDIPAAPSYHVLRSLIGQDAEINPPVANAATFTIDRTLDSVVTVSGVQYFVSNFSALNDGFQVDTLDLEVDLLYSNSYLLGESDNPLLITPGLRHREPMFLYLGGFTTDAGINQPGTPTFTGEIKSQRVEFNYAQLGGVSGPFDLTTAPVSADTADLEITGGDPPLTFDGNDEVCHFWQDARIRAFGRRPNGHETIAGSAVEFLFDRPGLNQILFHTTSQGPNFISTGQYGNFLDGGNLPRPTLETPLKDTEERFLDEIYRWSQNALNTVDPTFDGVRGNLVGPGLPFLQAKIEVPVRIGSNAPFSTASFTQSLRHLENLSISVLVSDEAQVGGFPDRNPPLSEGVTNPVPQTGLLQYPQTNFTTGFRPSVPDGDITNPQFNYTTATGDRVFLRCFDVSFSRSPVDERIQAEGQPFTQLFVRGLQVEDFAYVPGLSPGSQAIGIEVKVPGMTTWMDVGRRDGEGPSKQDPFVDGAGCQVLGAQTFNWVEPTTGEVGCQVRINVGPGANFFRNQLVGIEEGVVPLLVRVRIKDTVLGRALDWTQGGPDSPTLDCRGVASIGIVPKAGLFS